MSRFRMPRRQLVDVEDVQGLVHGFGRTWAFGRYFYLGVAEGAEAAARPRALLRQMPGLTSYAELRDGSPDVAWNVAFSHPGLVRLGLAARIHEGFPWEFQAGMAARAEMNGDTGASDPSNWPDYWSERRVDVVLMLYARSAEARQEADDALRAQLGDEGALEILDTQDVHRFTQTRDLDMHIEDPSRRPRDGAVLEHFGFRDGVSQPVHEGLDVRHVIGGGKHSEKEGWKPLATGELLLGHPDEAGEVFAGVRPPWITRNGTFVVLRKLRQHVDTWRAYLKEATRGVAAPDADTLAGLMIGRHQDGSALVDADGLNGFTFVSDPHGRRCPLGAHARRANPRNTMGDDTLLVNRHRILRRAITYGAPVPHGASEVEINGDAGQGLMFLALNANIERQFEFVQQQWINFGNDLGQGNDRDPVIGANAGRGQFVAPGNGARRTLLCGGLPDFVTVEGGEYLFLPGISACRQLLADGVPVYNW